MLNLQELRDIFIDSPVDNLVIETVQMLRDTPQWAELFTVDGIVPYERKDFSTMQLPVVRVYNNQYTKESESWFINGDLEIDIIFPPEIQREDLEQIPDIVAGAMMQQFRRPQLFDDLGQKVHGLNELGKVFNVDKTLGFSYGDDNLAPVTKIRCNFRIDLRAWDDYLEQSGRTKDQPFEVTLGKLSKVIAKIQGLKDDLSIDPTLDLNTKI